MHIKNDPGGGGFSGPFADLLRVQTEFQARLGEETMRYMRRLQGALGPASPGTVLLADAKADVKAAGVPGGRTELRLELENLQRVHSVVTPQLTPLVGEGGAAWFPASDVGTGFQIVPPGDVYVLVLGLEIPSELPPDTYRGALVLVGFSQGALPVTVRITAPPSAKKPAPRSRKSQKGRQPARRTRKTP